MTAYSYPNIGAYGPANAWDRASVLKQWFEEVDTTPILIISMGDSNMLRAIGSNWRINAGVITNEPAQGGMNAFTRVLHQRGPVNGTFIRNTSLCGIYGQGNNSAGPSLSVNASAAEFASAFNRTAPFNAGFTDAFWSIPAPWDPISGKIWEMAWPGGVVFGTSASNKNHGFALHKDHPFILDGDTITALYKYATFTTNGGSFRPSWRTYDGVSVYTNVVIDSLKTCAGTDAINNGSLVVTPANNPNKHRLEFRFDYAGVTPVVGNWYVPFSHCVNNKSGGIFHHCLGGMGGQSVFDMAQWATDVGATKIGNWIAEAIRGLRISNPASTLRVIFRVNSGVNDCAEDTLSHDGINLSNTATGFGSNRYKLFGVLEAAAVAAGVSTGNIRYWTELSQRQADTSTAYQAILDSFWAGMLVDQCEPPMDLAVDYGAQIVNVNLSALHTYAEFNKYEMGYAISRVYTDALGSIGTETTDTFHMGTFGYRTLYQRLFSSLLGPIHGASYRSTTGDNTVPLHETFFT